MTSARPRIACVGAGNHASTNLHPALRRQDVDLPIVCDLDAERLDRSRRRFGFEESSTDWRDALRVEPDAVLVCGPAELHAEVATAALQAGLPTFVEKPPAPTSEVARNMVEVAEQAGTWGMVGFMKRFAPRYRDAIRRIGEPTHVWVRYSHGMRAEPDRLLGTMTIHAIDLMCAMGSRPTSVDWAFATNDSNGLSARFRFSSGALGTLVSDDVLPGVTERVEVAGRGGFAVVDELVQLTHWPTSDDIWGTPEARAIRTNFPLQTDSTDSAVLQGYVPMIAEFVRCVRERTQPEQATLRDGAFAMELVDAMSAAREGRWNSAI